MDFGFNTGNEMLDETSEANLSAISFPSHVSGLGSFSDFDKTLNSSINESWQRDGNKPDIPALGIDDTLETPSDVRPRFSVNSSFMEGASFSSSNTDPLQFSPGSYGLKSPSTETEQLVKEYLSKNINPEFSMTVKPANKNKMGGNKRDNGNLVEIPVDEPQQVDDMLPGAFEAGMETRQRPGLDGSSSDSDDGGAANFARSRIGTSSHSNASAEDSIPQNLIRLPEERQLAEGDDLFSRDVPGDGGGGGDGSSGHSDSDVDGDGGVAIRVRNRRSQNSRARAAPYFAQAGINLPERERPVGDSVPVSNQQWRVQFLSNESASRDGESAVIPQHSHSESLPHVDLDSSQDSRLSGRYFVASSTPAEGMRQPNNWMDDSASRISESSPRTPRNEGANFLNAPTSDAFNITRQDTLRIQNEEDTTIVDEAGAMDFSEDGVEESCTTPIEPIQPLEKSAECNSSATKNPFRFPVESTNPFQGDQFVKNPFDDTDGAVGGAIAFSGFGEQIDFGFDSDFKTNSQDADALFDEDERSLEHSNTISKLANITEAAEWSLNQTQNRGEVRLSKYFQAYSEEMGGFGVDQEDKPRPNFDDYKAIKTPPAMERPAVLYNEAWRSENAAASNSLRFSPSSSANNTLTNDDKANPDLDPADHNTPDFDTQTEADRDSYTARGDDLSIDLPTTTGEAKSLLHDIEVGRVSLKGISGVNISNLAAKIASATNSDVNFIFNLLINYIEAAKNPSGSFSRTFKAPKQQSRRDDANAEKNRKQVTSDNVEKDGPVPDAFTSPSNEIEDILVGPNRALKLSDLYKEPGIEATSGIEKSSGKNADKKSLESMNDVDTSSLVTSSCSVTSSSHVAKPNSVRPRKSTASVATIRPVSSVTPLIASTGPKTIPSSSSAQSLSGITTQPFTTKHTESSRGVNSNDYFTDIRELKNTRPQFSSLKSTRSREDASLRQQTLTTLTETTAFPYDSPLSQTYNQKTRHLSSTVNHGDDPDNANPTKDIELSPVPLADGFLNSGNNSWKPLENSKASVDLAGSFGKAKALDTELPLREGSNDSLKVLKISGEEVQDILPRFSDINVRESMATFYPVMTANQSVMQGKTVNTRASEESVLNGKSSGDILSLHRPRSVKKKQSVIPEVQIVVPNDLIFSEVQCVGVGVNQSLPVHNPSSRWIQCLIEVSFYSVNGSQVELPEVCAFSMQPKMFIAPHTTEDVKITFYAQHAGVFMAKLNVIASAVVSDDSNLSEDDLFPNVVHVEAVAELPNVEILQENEEVIDFGEMPGGIVRNKALKLLNKGRARVPLKLVLSANYSIWKNFSFVNSDLTPINEACESSAEDILPPSLTIELPGGQQLGKTLSPVVVMVQFKAPRVQEQATKDILGPPQEFKARVDVEVNSKGSIIIIGSVLLKAVVGVTRLHAPRALHAISLSTLEGQRVSRGVPFRNAGNISLNINFQISTFTDLFSVVPEKVLLKPEESTEVFVHFHSPSSITVESFLLVTINPDGPQYEVVLRGTAAVQKQARQEEKPILLCNKQMLCWAGIPIGTSMQQRAFLRNNSLQNDLKMTIAVEGNHPDFQVQNTFDVKENNQKAFEVNLKPQNEIAVHVLFVPSTFGMITSALVIRPCEGGPKFRIPLHGYGGCSKLALPNAEKIGETYWMDAGEVSLGKQNIIKMALQNIGNRPAFVKIVCYSDVGKRQLYPSSHISVAPNDFVLAEKCTKQLVVVLQPTEAVMSNAKERIIPAASLAVFSGDECIRQLYRKSNDQPIERKISKEGPLQNLVFDSNFMDDHKISSDIDYPKVPNNENFFVSAVSRTIVSLIARTPVQEPLKKRPALSARDLLVTETPTRPLSDMHTDQGSSKMVSSDSTKLPERKENWTVTPEHIVLTAPNTVSDKSTARIQMINYSEKPLSFEFSWPAKSLIITPCKDSVPPRSQLIVFVSTKSSFVTTGDELPWRGCIYVQCEGVQKRVRVQIREDLALDSSPVSNPDHRLTRLKPANDVNTPHQEKSSSNARPLISVEPQSVVFSQTLVNRCNESCVQIVNHSSATMKWVLSSIAPPYFKDNTESRDIFRTTYAAFRFLKQSGNIQPRESNTIQVTFQPRDSGEYSQFWDLQAAAETTADICKSRIELRGAGFSNESEASQNDRLKFGRAQPILKPADESSNEPEKGRKSNEREPDSKSALPKPSERRNRGLFVKDEVLNFKPTVKGGSQEMQFKLCNDTMELQKVRLSGLKLPFSIKHTKLAIKSKSFLRIPVCYSPTEPGLKSEGNLEVTPVSGSARTSFVKVVGICIPKT